MIKLKEIFLIQICSSKHKVNSMLWGTIVLVVIKKTFPIIQKNILNIKLVKIKNYFNLKLLVIWDAKTCNQVKKLIINFPTKVQDYVQHIFLNMNILKRISCSKKN